MAGLCAAISAAEAMHMQDNIKGEILLLDAGKEPGHKILATGNGRCNMTNLSLKAEHYRSSQKQFPMKVLDRFSVWDTLTFFDEIGIVTKNKKGYIYPNSEQASAVLDSLRLELSRLGVRIVVDCHIRSVKKNKKGGFAAESDRGSFHADRLILAAGSKAAPVTGSDGSGYELIEHFGHKTTRLYPAITQIKTETEFVKQLKSANFVI